jgi:hypothetical protein
MGQIQPDIRLEAFELFVQVFNGIELKEEAERCKY